MEKTTKEVKQVSSHTPENYYASMPLWRKSRYGSFSEWARECFRTGKRESEQEIEQLKKERKARTEQTAYNFQVRNDALADNIKLTKENEKLKADKAVLLEALKKVINEAKANAGDVHFETIAEASKAIKQINQ